MGATERLLHFIHKYGDAVRILNLPHRESLRTNSANWPIILFLLLKLPHVQTTHCRLTELLWNNEPERDWRNGRAII